MLYHSYAISLQKLSFAIYLSFILLLNFKSSDCISIKLHILFDLIIIHSFVRFNIDKDNILFWYLIWSNLSLVIFFWNWNIQTSDKNISCIVFICSNSRVIRSNFSRVAHRLEDNSHFSRVYSLIKFGR